MLASRMPPLGEFGVSPSPCQRRRKIGPLGSRNREGATRTGSQDPPGRRHNPLNWGQQPTRTHEGGAAPLQRPFHLPPKARTTTPVRETPESFGLPRQYGLHSLIARASLAELATGHVAVIRKGPAPDRQEFREIGPSRRWFKVSGIPEPTWRPPMENSAAPPAQGPRPGRFHRWSRHGDRGSHNRFSDRRA